MVVALAGLCAGPLPAAEMVVTVHVPRLSVAEYHRPYVAMWVEREDHGVAANLAVWYEVANDEGPKWLADLRQWWRRSGRSLDVPIDGVTGATRPPGRHRLHFTDDTPALSALPEGPYRLVVEAAREVGGRELLRLPFHWPPAEPQTLSVEGGHELGAVVLELTP